MTPSALILVAANSLPIIGVVFWGWDAFVLLMLYWLETAIIGFWTIVRLVSMDADGRADIRFGSRSGRALGRLGVGLFFTVHASIFMTVHFIFLWALFSGAWSARIHGIGDFIREMVIGTGLWLPLAVLFLVRGAVILGPAIRRRLGFTPVGAPEPATGQSVLLGLYLRIVVMQVAIILGAWMALLAGSVGALVLLVVLKTIVDVYFDPIARHVEAAARKAEKSG